MQGNKERAKGHRTALGNMLTTSGQRGVRQMCTETLDTRTLFWLCNRIHVTVREVAPGSCTDEIELRRVDVALSDGGVAFATSWHGVTTGENGCIAGAIGLGAAVLRAQDSLSIYQKSQDQSTIPYMNLIAAGLEKPVRNTIPRPRSKTSKCHCQYVARSGQ